MNKVLKVISFIKVNILYPASLYTLLIGTFFMLLGIQDIEPSITLGLLSSFFCYSLVLASSSLLLRVEKMPIVLRYVIHFAVNIISFVVLWHVCYPQSIGVRTDEYNFMTGKFIWDINPKNFVFGLCIFTIIYVIIASLSLLKKAFKSTEKQKEEEYESIF